MKAITHYYIYKTTLLLLLVACFSACEDVDVSGYYASDQYVEEKLSLSINTINVGYEGGNQSFQILNNSRWEYKSGETDWLTIDKKSGEGNATIAVKINANEGENERSTTLIFSTATGISVSLPVSQAAMERTLNLTKSSITVTAKNGESTFGINSNTSWTITSDAEWIILDQLKGINDATISVKCTDNHSMEKRTATITVSAGQTVAPKTCVIEQEAGKRPDVSVTTVSNVLRYSAELSATYTSEFPVEEYGFTYSTDTDPIVNGIDIIFKGEGTGYMETKLEGLKSGVTYSVRAYAKSAVGYNYGEVVLFTTTGLTPGEDDNTEPSL